MYEHFLLPLLGSCLYHGITLVNAANYHVFCGLDRNLHTKKVVLKFEDPLVSVGDRQAFFGLERNLCAQKVVRKTHSSLMAK